jgi:hypothetical protein
MSIFVRPGLHTDVQESGKSLRDLRALGFEWIVYQVQNVQENGELQLKNRSLEEARSAGMKAGVWGVSYQNRGGLARDAAALRSLGGSMNAELYVFNVEYVHDPEPYIEVFKTYAGPKAIIMLVGDLPAMRDRGALKKLLDAGWDIIVETYTNDQPTLTVSVAEELGLRMGVPKERLSHALGMYHSNAIPGVSGTHSGVEYALDLANAGVTNRFSAWMVEHATMGDYVALARAITPADQAPDPLEELVQKLNLVNTGVNAALGNLEKVFDANAIPEPDGVDALKAYLLALGAKTNELVEAVNALQAER